MSLGETGKNLQICFFLFVWESEIGNGEKNIETINMRWQILCKFYVNLIWIVFRENSKRFKQKPIETENVEIFCFIARSTSKKPSEPATVAHKLFANNASILKIIEI